MSKDKKYIGMYVCYDQMDGGACWGRIKDEAVVNTMYGEREVFILTDRYVRTPTTSDRKRFGQFYPDAVNDPNLRKPVQQGSQGVEEPEVTMRVMKVRGDTTVRKEMLNLESDVVDIGDALENVDEDTLFKAVLDARADGQVDGKTAFEIGMSALSQSSNGTYNQVASELKRRLGMETQE